MRLVVALTLCFATLTADAFARSPARRELPEDPAKHYEACMNLARKQPTEGWEEALAWSSLGGGEPAAHCAAVALMGLEQYGEAATRLERLAETSHQAPGLRALILEQAGQAWLMEGKPDRAYGALTTGIKLDPHNPDLLVDRAQALAAAANYREAEADLTAALKLAPKEADILTFRASARRYLDNVKGARADIDQALKLDPGFADAWVESGTLRRIAGDDAGARKDWIRALELSPKSPAGDAARRNIELLDIPNE